MSATALRRATVLAVLLGVAAAAASWVRRRATADAPAAPAEWPPIHPEVVATGTAAVDDEPAPTGWVAAGEGLEPPQGFPVKVKVSSGIFHVPGGRFYDRTNADRFYATADEAEADGYRRSKS
jgi:large subunit ribosomal protein L17